MHLTDKELLELNELCGALIDGTLTEAQRARLGQWLRDSEAARRFYVRAMGLSASLHHYASEMQGEEPKTAPDPFSVLRVAWYWWAGAFGATACLILGFWLLGGSKREPLPTTIVADEYVARLTGAKECIWRDAQRSPQTGDLLRRGQVLDLRAGFAEITFDSGAQVVLEGPAVLKLTSPWDATLKRGTIRANVCREAIGFTVTSELVEVVDLGTEFSIIVEDRNHAEVFVLKGEVEARPRAGGGHEALLLRQSEARRFARSGISEVQDSEAKFARLSRVVPLDRFDPPVRYVRWTFDEWSGQTLVADEFGPRLPAYDATLIGANGRGGALRVQGVSQNALCFDGVVFAKAPFPGISGKSPRTVLFWVKVPPDAQLSSAYAMVAWWADNPKLGSRPVHIGWNRNPSEGPVGVLRTDYLGGYALGTTSLRDGRWHHVAVVFVPGADGERPVEVKQYVDGRLEGEGRPSPPGGEFLTEPNPVVSNTLWLGCRLGDTGPKRDRFRGVLDELCVADVALGPQQIVHLMHENRPSTLTVAITRSATDGASGAAPFSADRK